jgi:hypothetical protein
LRRECLLVPAIAAGERVAGDALVPPDEHVPIDAAPTEAEALVARSASVMWSWAPLPFRSGEMPSTPTPEERVARELEEARQTV